MKDTLHTCSSNWGIVEWQSESYMEQLGSGSEQKWFFFQEFKGNKSMSGVPSPGQMSFLVLHLLHVEIG